MPEDLTTDGAGELVGPKSKFNKFFTKHGNHCALHVTLRIRVCRLALHDTLMSKYK